MRFDELLSQCGTLPWFDYQTVLLLFPEGEESVRTSLYRHRRGGRVIELRRGFYAFAERYRPSSLPAPALAGILHAPSYLSELWALSWHGIIPEKAVIMTSESPKPPATYDNTFGSYRYRSIKQALFWGCSGSDHRSEVFPCFPSAGCADRPILLCCNSNGRHGRCPIIDG